MQTSQRIRAALALAAAGVLSMASARAEGAHGGHGGGPSGHEHFGGAPHYSHVPPAPHLADHWHEGYWHHGEHLHRDGWWWVVGGLWLWYPEPVYPYPDVYLPPQLATPSAPAAPPAQYWYYCDQPAGYYPYITRCDHPWTAVTATPPPSPPAGY